VVALTDRERGQLLLAGAFILAIALIGLTIVMNASAQTTTMASKENAVARGGDALSVRGTVRADLARMVHKANTGVVDFDDRRDRVRQEFGVYAGHVEHYYARNGRSVGLTTDPVSTPFQRGTRIRQKTSATMDDPADPGDGDFDIASDTYLRNATFVFTSVTGGASDRFTLALDENPADSSAWSMDIWTQGGAVHVETVDPTGEIRECTVPESTVTGSSELTVDIDEARVGGSYCEALENFGTGIGPYDILFRGGDTVNGRYWLTVALPEDSLRLSILTSAAPQTEKEEVIYRFSPRFTYYTGTVSYETDLRIAPGELP
jgi:hypothetical protein